MNRIKNLIATIAIGLSMNSLAETLANINSNPNGEDVIQVKSKKEIDAKVPVCQGDGDIGGDHDNSK